VCVGVGCWLLVVGCWLLVVGCWLLVVGCWLLVVGCWLLDVGCWLLVVGCWLLHVIVGVSGGRCSLGGRGGEGLWEVEEEGAAGTASPQDDRLPSSPSGAVGIIRPGYGEPGRHPEWLARILEDEALRDPTRGRRFCSSVLRAEGVGSPLQELV